MNILRFFDKYNKYILGFGVSILMVIFLIPGAQFLMPGPASFVVGEVDGWEITQAEMQEAGKELEVLSMMYPGMVPSDALAWLLALHEAHENGIYSSDAAVENLLTDIMNQGVNAAALVRMAGGDELRLYNALQNLLAYQEYAHLVNGGLPATSPLVQRTVLTDRPSEPRLRHMAMDTLSRASAEVVLIDASHMMTADDAAPSGAELESLFDEYRDKVRGEGDGYRFGYMLPNRVRFEYLAVELDDVMASIEVDEVEANRYYLVNRERYVDAESGETSGYREVRESVISELRRVKALEKQNQMVAWLEAQLLERTRRVGTDDEGYLELGSGWEPLSFEDLAAQAQQRFGVLPTYVRMDERWHPLSELSEIEGLGGALYSTGTRSVGLADVMSDLRELRGEDEEAVAGGLRVVVGQYVGPFEGTGGGKYLVRALAAERAHEPETLEEVRLDVERDARRLRAYRALTDAGRMELILGRAKEEPWDEFAESFNSEVKTIPTISGVDAQAAAQAGSVSGEQSVVPVLPDIGRSSRFVTAVLGLAHELSAGGVAESEAAEKTIVVPLDHQQQLAVTRLLSYEPVDGQTYRMMKGLLRAQSEDRQMVERIREAGGDETVIARPLSLEALKERTGYVSTSPGMVEGEAEASGAKPAGGEGDAAG